MAIVVNSSNFEQEVVQSKMPVVIDVYGTRCGACKIMMPLFEQLSQEFADTCKLVTLNADEDREIALRYNVTSVPAFVFIKAGKMVGKEIGSMSKDTLKTKIQNILR